MKHTVYVNFLDEEHEGPLTSTMEIHTREWMADYRAYKMLAEQYRHYRPLPEWHAFVYGGAWFGRYSLISQVTPMEIGL